MVAGGTRTLWCALFGAAADSQLRACLSHSRVSQQHSPSSTSSERYLAQLCRRSFLKLWSYPHLFRDQRQAAGKGDGKEIADLVVVFGNDVLVFSDRACAFPNTGDPDADWRRWYRKAILRAAHQTFGAERWLRDYPARVFLDPLCTRPIPIQIPAASEMRVHRIVVALGATARHALHSGQEGALLLNPAVDGDAQPFAVGQIDPRGFVHVYDDVSLDIVLQELDTAPDFISYLEKKERLLLSRQLVGAIREPDLLALYLRNRATDAETGFGLSRSDVVLLESDGLWATLAAHPQYVARKQADSASYVCDQIIDAFGDDVLKGVLLGTNSVYRVEEALRAVASLSRFDRRMLAQALVGLLQGPNSGDLARRIARLEQRPDTLWVIVANPLGSTDDEFERLRRARHLHQYCLAVAARYRERRQVVGIGTELGIGNRGRSFDLVMVRVDRWTAEIEREAEEAALETRAFRVDRLPERRGTVYEYPQIDVPAKLPMKVGRNEPCWCGSGLKYKKCHGKAVG